MGGLFRRQRHTFDAATRRHAFRGSPTLSLWAGVALFVLSAGFAVIGSVDGAIDGRSVVLWVFAALGIWVGFRCTRVGVYVSPKAIKARNFFNTRSAERRQIIAIDLNGRNEGESGFHWFPQVQLRDGSKFWLSSLDCGRVGKSLSSESLEMLHEIRAILQVGGFWYESAQAKSVEVPKRPSKETMRA